MIEGVEGFRVELGIDSLSETGGAVNYGAAIVWADPDTRTTPTNRGDGVADGDFITCTTATPCTAAQLANVTAVKLYVLVRGRDESQGYTDTKTYSLAGDDDGTVQRWLQAPRLRDDGAPAQYHGPESHAMILSSKYKQRGAALVVGLIMLVLITLMLMTALNLGTANFRSVSNMQFREEAIAAANQAIEQVISSTFTAVPVAETIEIDIDNDDDRRLCGRHRITGVRLRDASVGPATEQHCARSHDDARLDVEHSLGTRCHGRGG